MTSIKQEMISLDAAESWVNWAGKPDKPAIVMIHGSGPGATAWSNWQYAMPTLCEDFFVVAPDLAGFGRSPMPDPAPADVTGWMDVWVSQILSLIHYFKLQRVNVLGNSLGGAVALHSVLRRTETFSRLALMGAAGVPFKLTRELDLIWGFYDSPSRHRMEALISWFAWDENFLGDKLQEIAAMRFDAAMEPSVRNAFSLMFPAPRQRHVDAMAVANADLRRIKTPTLLIHGQEDPIVPLETSIHLARHLGGPVQLHVYNHCSHWTQIEYRDSFEALVGAFFRGTV